jgi:hypothetical protein
MSLTISSGDFDLEKISITPARARAAVLRFLAENKILKG